MARVVPGAWAVWGPPDVELTAADRVAVEKAVGRALADDEWGRLAAAVVLYSDGVNLFRQRPRAKVVRGKLDRLAKAARELAAALADLAGDDNDSQAAASMLSREDRDADPHDIQDKLWSVVFAAEAGVARLPAVKDGRDPDLYLSDLIAAVVAVMGESASNPAVARVTEALMTVAGKKPKTITGVVKAVERARQK